jgi:WD40 repeat protein
LGQNFGICPGDCGSYCPSADRLQHTPQDFHRISQIRRLQLAATDCSRLWPFPDVTEVSSVAFSPNSLHLVSGSHDCTLRVWDTRTGGTVLGPLRGHSGAVRSVAFSADGRRIVSGSDDGTVRLWDADLNATVEPLGSFVGT